MSCVTVPARDKTGEDMSEQNQGRVVPFTFTASRIRRSAERHRRQGRPVDAVELLRQTAQRHDLPTDWVALAEALADMACYEQAATILFRLMARPEPPAAAWLLLARCQKAMGRRESAIDCLYHYLALDPFSDAADSARAMLNEIEGTDAEHEAYRLPKLMRRGLLSWRAGDREKGKRRLHRAARMAGDPARIYITLALLMLAERDPASAVRELEHAMRRDPGSARALTAMCVAQKGIGNDAEADMLLEMCAERCSTPDTEEMFLTAAWTLDDQEAQKRYLIERLKKTPCRIALMLPLAALYMAEGKTQEAKKLWQRVLRIDPTDQRARICLEWAEKHPGELLPDDGSLPVEEVRERMLRLVHAAEAGTSCHELIAQGSGTRMIADWSFTLQDPSLQRAVLELISREEHPEVVSYLKQLLTCPTAAPEVREEALERLEEMGEAEQVMMLVGASITTLQKANAGPEKHPEASFLSLLLEESAKLRQAMPLVFYAAGEWHEMDRRQRHLAACEDSYAYVKTIELLYLRETGQDELAMKVLKETQVSKRRIERVMRSLAPRHELLKGED